MESGGIRYFFIMKALALLSGGLDSILAARLILDQEIEVVGVGFSSPFFSSRRGRQSASALGVEFRSYDISKEYIDILLRPKYGYGKNCNPCTDCHRLMVSIAGRHMEEIGAAFIITGEVIGQRPKSQTRDALNAVAKAVKPGLILRPLSALLLAETIPEKEGWVDRSKLLNLSGRSRKIQFALAERYGLKDYSSPGGGCLLTDSSYCRKLMELRSEEGWDLDELELLRVGRHFRIRPGVRVVSGRNDQENHELLRLAKNRDYLFQACRNPGSLIVLRSRRKVSREDINTAASICARYSKGKRDGVSDIGFRSGAEKEEVERVPAIPMPPEELNGLRI